MPSAWLRRNTAAPTKPNAITRPDMDPDEMRNQLTMLKKLYDEGLITEEVMVAKQKAILARF